MTDRNDVLQQEIRRGQVVWDTRKEWFNIIADSISNFPRRVIVGQDGRTIPCKFASTERPA